VERGEVGDRVARNLRRLRERRNLTLQALSERLSELGRPILASGLSKIEQGDRRVDVDDLAALANALDTVPSQLLEPSEDLMIETAEQRLADKAQSEIIGAAIKAIRACEAEGISRYELLEWVKAGDQVREFTKNIAGLHMQDPAISAAMESIGDSARQYVASREDAD
jgi:transcriptional regulator with XRE-family HTH domain